jgi:hypothetical protein
MSVSGCNDHYEFVLGAGTKAKTVTNNLPILSVLAFVILKFYIDSEYKHPRLVTQMNVANLD